LIPSDDFSQNLKFLLTPGGMEDVELVIGLEKRLGVVITNQEAEKTKTIHDVVTLIHQKWLRA
jgi:acyl carrier protein